MTPIQPAAARVDTRHPQYQELKSRVHQGLLNRLNLERLTRTSREEAEPEIRGVIMGMLDGESDKIPLSLYERQSLIMTTNLDFSQWPQVFGSEQLTGALLDRLTHHAHILTMNGESFRFRESMSKKGG